MDMNENNGPYSLSNNYVTLKCKVEKMEEIKESQSGHVYMVIWTSQKKYFKNEPSTYDFKFVVFNELAHKCNLDISVGDYIRASGELKGSNNHKEDAVFNNLEFRVSEISKL